MTNKTTIELSLLKIVLINLHTGAFTDGLSKVPEHMLQKVKRVLSELHHSDFIYGDNQKHTYGLESTGEELLEIVRNEPLMRRFKMRWAGADIENQLPAEQLFKALIVESCILLKEKKK